MKRLFSKRIQKACLIYPPVHGKTISIEEVSDPMFSGRLLGDGFAVIPDGTKICSPADGTITAVFPTKHLIGITTPEGAEILIHIGLETAKLNGDGFRIYCRENQKVTGGSILAEVDFANIQKKGYETTTITIVTNIDKFPHSKIDVDAPAGKPVMIIKKE